MKIKLQNKKKYKKRNKKIPENTSSSEQQQEITTYKSWLMTKNMKKYSNYGVIVVHIFHLTGSTLMSFSTASVQKIQNCSQNMHFT